MNFSFIFCTYILPSIPIIAVLLAYFLGKTAYFRQKEYELITKRYLEDGIDSISINIDRSLAIVRHNWWHCTVVLKSFRDLGKDMRPELYKEGLIEPETSNFELWRNYRLKDIVGDDIFHRVHQLLDAFVKSSYAFFRDDLCNGIRVTLDGGQELQVVVSRTEIFDEMLKRLIEIDKNALKYYEFLGELQNISKIIQTNRFSFSNIDNIKGHSVVKNAVTHLKKTFKDELAESDQLKDKEIAEQGHSL